MKERSLALLLVALLLGTMLLMSVTAQGPEEGAQDVPDVSAHRRDAVDRSGGGGDRPASGILQIDNSTVNYVDPAELPAGLGSLLCFNVTVDSPDLEYMDRFDVDLPDNWDVIDVLSVPQTGCGTPTIEGVEAGMVVYWQIDSAIPSQCGSWSNGTYDFCAIVYVPDCSGEPWSFPWNIIGDGFGTPPHQASSTSGQVSCGELVLQPSFSGTTSCHASAMTETLNLFNDTGSDGMFSFTYGVPSGNATLTGPDGIYLGDGVDQDLLVVLMPSLCVPAGQHITATATVSGEGFEDTSLLVWGIRASGQPGCPRCNPVFLPIVLRN